MDKKITFLNRINIIHTVCKGGEHQGIITVTS